MLPPEQILNFATQIGASLTSPQLLSELASMRVDEGMTPDDATMSAQLNIQCAIDSIGGAQ